MPRIFNPAPSNRDKAWPTNPPPTASGLNKIRVVSLDTRLMRTQGQPRVNPLPPLNFQLPGTAHRLVDVTVRLAIVDETLLLRIEPQRPARLHCDLREVNQRA